MQCFTPQRSWEFIQSSALLSVQSNADLSSCLHTHSFLFRLATYKYKVQLTGRQTGDQGLLLGLQFGFSEEHTDCCSNKSIVSLSLHNAETCKRQ